MRIRGLYLMLLLGVLAWSTCLDEIEIEPADRPETGYVIQGSLVAGEPAAVSIRVERLFFFTSNINQIVSDAQVSLVAESGTSQEIAWDAANRVYQATLDAASFPVEEGQRYRVEVSLSDGTAIESDWDEVMPAPAAGNLNWQFTEVETEGANGVISLRPGIAFSVDGPLLTSTGDAAQIRWEFIDAYRITDNLDSICYVENQHRAGQVILLDGTEVGGDAVQNYPLFSDLIGLKLIEGYYLTAYQQSLSPDAFDYWKEVQLLLEREGTVFDNPAGRVATNLRNTTDSTGIVYGYFSAYQQDTIRLFVSRGDMGNLASYCPRPPTNQPFPPITICDNCIDALGASYEQPFYWEE